MTDDTNSMSGLFKDLAIVARGVGGEISQDPASAHSDAIAFSGSIRRSDGGRILDPENVTPAKKPEGERQERRG